MSCYETNFFEVIHSVGFLCMHLCTFSALYWPSWACRSCERLLLSVSGHCDPLLQSCGPAWVQKPGDPVKHWTNSGALPHRFRPPQTLPTAGGPWQPNDEHSAGFQIQSSSGKPAIRHWAGLRIGSQPIKINNRNHCLSIVLTISVYLFLYLYHF